MESTVIQIVDACKKCMVCTELCPNLIMKKNEQEEIYAQPERVHLCIACGQCMAACSAKAIHVSGLDYDRDFFDVKTPEDSAAVFDGLIQTRRSVRNFKDRSVPREMLEKIAEAISFAPPAFPPIKFSLVIVQDTTVMRKALPSMVSLYEGMLKMMKRPMIRYFIRKEIGKQRFKTLDHHLVPILEADLPLMTHGNEDTLMRHAPAMILFLGNKDREDINADVYIAVTVGTLAAHAYGLGSTIVDVIPPAIQRNPELRKHFGIPDNKDVIASLIIGYPKYKYHRAVKRNIPSVEWR